MLSDETPRLVSSSDWASAFWDHLNVPVLVLGLPLTYPAKPVNETMIGSAHFSPSLKDFTYPENLTHVAQEYGYVPDENVFPDPTWWEAGNSRAVGLGLLAQEELTRHLLYSEAWDLGISYFQQTDMISHFYGMVSSAASEASFQTSSPKH